MPGLYTSELASGGFFDLSNPDPSVIRLGDVAQGLGNLCRFNGQCSRFYSVAEHAVLVAYRLEQQGFGLDVCLAGLHHDDAEALTCDVPRPLKKLLPDFEAIEERVFTAVTEALGISQLPFDHPAVKDADNWALQREAFELMPSKGEHWFAALQHPGGPAPWNLGWDPNTARTAWWSDHVHRSAELRRAA